MLRMQLLWLILVFYVFSAVSLADNYECGVYALEKALSLLDIHVDYDTLKEKLLTPEVKGTSFSKINEIARKYGAKTEAVRIDVNELFKVEWPVIVFLKDNHFVVIAARDPILQRFYILDKNKSPFWVEVSEFDRNFHGEVIILKRKNKRNKPIMWTESYYLNFGNFYGISGEKKKKTILNIGQKPLILNKALFSCQCATLKFSPKVIPPNSYGELLFDFDVSNRPEGEFSLGMHLKTNEDKSIQRSFKLSGTVNRKIILRPSYFSLGDILPDEKHKILVSKLFIGGDYSGDVSMHPASLNTCLSLLSAKKLKSDGSFEIKTLVDFAKIEKNNNGRFFHTQHLKTEHEIYKYFEIGIAGKVLPWLSIMPESIFINNHKPNEVINKELKLINRSNSEIVVKYSDPDVIKQIKIDNGHVVVEIICPDDGFFKTEIVLTLEDQDFIIPIYCRGN